MMYMKAKTVIVCLFFIIASFTVTSAEQNTLARARFAIVNAQAQIANCYTAALAAENTGANISQLTLTLNSAGVLLSNAEHAYATGDSEEAQRLATQSQDLLINFISEASTLEDSAKQATSLDFLINVVGSVVGTIVVIIGSIIVWVLLKKKSVTKGEAVVSEHNSI
jgi:hypothetical protein